MRVLITGSSGFLGYELTKYFLKKNFSVISTYNSKKPKLSKNKNLKLLKIDLTREKLTTKCDIIIHCASVTPVNSKDNKKLYISNMKMFKNVTYNFENIKKFFFMSTMSVYGEIKTKKINEKTKSNRPNYYGKSKIDCEKILLKLQKKNKILSIVLRLPGTVGKTSHSNFITNLVNKLLNNKQIEINNLESKFNNIVHSKDIFLFISRTIKKNKKGFYLANLASKNPVKIKNILRFLINKTNFKNKILFKKNTKSFIIDLSIAKKIGFKPRSVFNVLSTFLYNKRLQVK